LALMLLIGATAFVLFEMGRVWWCECGEPFLWSGDIWCMHNSQHLADPYSFSHMLHGLIFAWVIYWIKPLRKLPFAWRLIPATALEAGWEIFENTPLVINRYREATMALGYSGDSIGNSLGDLACCIFGFLIASGVRWYWSLAIFLATELGMLVMIRDNLTLNVIMLIYPIEAIQQWQMAIY
jgi:Protein of unknown function (DUF2585)